MRFSGKRERISAVYRSRDRRPLLFYPIRKRRLDPVYVKVTRVRDRNNTVSRVYHYFLTTR